MGVGVGVAVAVGSGVEVAVAVGVGTTTSIKEADGEQLVAPWTPVARTWKEPALPPAVKVVVAPVVELRVPPPVPGLSFAQVTAITDVISWLFLSLAT